MSIDLNDNLALAQRPRLREACIKLQNMAQELGPATKLPTVVELRDQLGMSLQTVNSAIRELERRQVLYSVNGVGVYVAEKTSRARTATLGFMTNNIRHVQNLPYYERIMDGMRSEAQERDRHILIIDNVERFYQWEKIDGALFIDKNEKSYPCPSLPRLPKGMPCLAVLNPVPGITSVTADDFQALKGLTRHLIDLGHRRIAYVAAFDEVENLEQRLQGYLAAMREGGIEVEDSWLRHLYMGDLQRDAIGFEDIGRRHIQRWLADGWDKANCTAIIAQNDATAVGMIKALHDTGHSVPQDITVVGFDGVASPSFGPRLTTVEVPLFAMGQTSVRILCDWIEEPAEIPSDIALPGRLVVGDTSAPPAKVAVSK